MKTNMDIDESFSGKKITFDDNEIRFYQDFRFYTNIVPNVEFEIVRSDQIDFEIRANGFGGIPLYGNGSIFITKKDLFDYLIAKL